MWETPIFLHIWHMSSTVLQSLRRYLSVPPLLASPIHCHRPSAVAVPALCDYTGSVWLRSLGMPEDAVASSVLTLGTSVRMVKNPSVVIYTN